MQQGFCTVQGCKYLHMSREQLKALDEAKHVKKIRYARVKPCSNEDGNIFKAKAAENVSLTHKDEHSVNVNKLTQEPRQNISAIRDRDAFQPTLSRGARGRK
jgi:hypothetical protein